MIRRFSLSCRDLIILLWHRRLLDDSGLFDRRFYREQLTGANQSQWGSWLPLCHYVFEGCRRALNPSPAFDTVWYLSANADVARVGLNPLAHYVRAGRYEGRLPFAAAAAPFFDPPPSISPVDWLCHKLWGGFPHLAEPALSELACSEDGERAALELASLAYCQSRLSDALRWLEGDSFSRRAGREPRRLRGLAKAYSLLGRHEDLEALLKQPGVTQTLGADADYVAANLHTDPTQRLAPVNQRLSRQGLVPLTCSSGVELSGLVPEFSPPAMPSGEKPLISVIVPAYNAGAGLAVALDSLLNQTWRSIEIIVVDDASTDDTQDWAEHYCLMDDRVRYCRNEHNMGAYPTRNRGLAQASGEFVTVHDSDDWSHPQKLEAQINPLLDDETLAATVSHWVRVTPDLHYVGCWMMGEGFVELNPSSWLIRRRWLETLGGWDDVNVGADSEFSQRLEYYLGRKAVHYLWPDTPLALARVDANTLTRTKATHLSTLFFGLRRLYAESARWWLRSCKGTPVMNGERPFPAPLGNIRCRSDSFDVLVAGNFAVRGRALEVLIRQLNAVAKHQKSTCLLHWPAYSEWHGNTIADEVFAFCQEKGLHFAHAGLTLKAPEVILLEPGLWQKPTSETVRLEGLESVMDIEGRLCDDQVAICDYFRQGGVVTGSAV